MTICSILYSVIFELDYLEKSIILLGKASNTDVTDQLRTIKDLVAYANKIQKQATKMEHRLKLYKTKIESMCKALGFTVSRNK